MAIERKFIHEQIKKLRIDLYIHKELARVGCGDVEVKRTPLGNRVIIHSTKPGLVIGRKGKNIEMLTNVLKKRFKMDNPQIEVQEISTAEFDPDIMAKQLAGSLERGFHFRRSSYRLLRQIMSAGALGCEIGICGKVSGGRSRNEKFKEGYIKHCGDTADKYVKTAVTQAVLKAGVLGIRVKITPPMEGRFNELRLIEPKPGEEKKAEEPKTGGEKSDKEEEKPEKGKKQEKEKKPKKEPEKKQEKLKQKTEKKEGGKK